jgi:hypothetical protein
MYATTLKRKSFLTLCLVLLIVAAGGLQAHALDSVTAIDGTWKGRTDRGHPMSFKVTSSGTQWSTFSLMTDFSGNACGGSVSGKFTTTLSTTGAITANEFSYSSSTYTFGGEFISAGRATGSYAFTNHPIIVSPLPVPCYYYLTQSGTWTATPIVTLNSSGSEDGWILESSATSGVGGTLNSGAATFKLGDDADRKQCRAILSFDTSIIPDDAVITRITLKVKESGIVGGGDPVSIFQGFMVDIKKGSFGASALALGDFSAGASKTYGPFSPALSSGWYSLKLTNGKANLNKRGLTQIRLRFKLEDNSDATANFLKLYSGNASSPKRPKLIVEYYVP